MSNTKLCYLADLSHLLGFQSSLGIDCFFNNLPNLSRIRSDTTATSFFYSFFLKATHNNLYQARKIPGYHTCSDDGITVTLYQYFDDFIIAVDKRLVNLMTTDYLFYLGPKLFQFT